MLSLVRAATFIAIGPPFNSRAIPAVIKIGIAASLAVVTAPNVGAENLSMEWLPLTTAVATQVAAGMLLGFLSFLIFSAVQGAGALVDLFGGFTVAPAYDPLSNLQSSTFGRVYQLIATTLLFAMNGHLMLVKGFLTSFKAVPLGGFNADRVGATFATQAGAFFLAAMEIAAPMMAALFLAEVILGLLSRAAPLMNVFALGFPFKILVTIFTVGMTLPLLPDATRALTENILRSGKQLIGG